jgi:hypothetical protein
MAGFVSECLAVLFAVILCRRHYFHKIARREGN